MPTSIELALQESSEPMPTNETALVDTTQTETSDSEYFTSECLRYVTRYNQFAKKTAEGIINLGRTTLEAGEKLNEHELNRFCEAVDLDPKGPTFRKLRKIGEQATRLEYFTDKMPTSWTIIHRLATLKGDEFDRVTSDPRFGISMKGRDISEILAKDSVGRKNTGSKISITLGGLTEVEKAEFCKELADLQQRFSIELKVDEELEATFATVRQQRELEQDRSLIEAANG